MPGDDVPDSRPLTAEPTGTVQNATGDEGVEINCKAPVAPKDAEEGSPGTPHHVGRLIVPDSDYSAPRVRSTIGHWGAYERLYRADETARESILGITTQIRASDHPVQLPEHAQDDETAAAAAEWVRGWWRRLQPRQFLAEAVRTALIYGFSPWEIVWEQDENGYYHPKTVKYRSPSSVHEWILDGEERSIIGARFHPYSANGYTLQRGGQVLPKGWKLLVVNIDAVGLNIEGIAPMRSVSEWIQLKMLGRRVTGVAVEKWGQPIAAVKEDREAGELPPGGNANAQDRQKLRKIVNYLRAEDAPVVQMEPDQLIEFFHPDSKFPDYTDVIKELADEQIAKMFRNQGAQLAGMSTGSYALADVEDDKALRAAYGYYLDAIQSVNDLIASLCERYFDADEMSAYPRVAMSPDLGTDAAAKLEQLQGLMANRPITQWPEPLQRMAMEYLGESKDLADKLQQAASKKPEEAPDGGN